jgi:hypothetical protein
MPRLKVKRPVDRRVRYRHVATVVLYSADERERPPETFKEGRRCRRCGCRLSIYHPGADCWPCTAGARWERS